MHRALQKDRKKEEKDREIRGGEGSNNGLEIGRG